MPGVVTCTGAGALADAPPSPSAPKTEGSPAPAARSGEMWAGTAASSPAVDTVCSAGSLWARAGVTLVEPGPKLGAGPSSMRMGDTLMAGTSTGALTAVADAAVGTSPPMTSRSGQKRRRSHVSSWGYWRQVQHRRPHWDQRRAAAQWLPSEGQRPVGLPRHTLKARHTLG